MKEYPTIIRRGTYNLRETDKKLEVLDRNPLVMRYGGRGGN